MADSGFRIPDRGDGNRRICRESRPAILWNLKSGIWPSGLPLTSRRGPRPSGVGLRRGGLLEDDDVLPGEEVVQLLEGEPLGLDLLADLGDGHLMFGLD